MKGESSAAEQERFVLSEPRLVGDVSLGIVEALKSMKHKKNNICFGLGIYRNKKSDHRAFRLYDLAHVLDHHYIKPYVNKLTWLLVVLVSPIS